jgi:hypothetical protein
MFKENDSMRPGPTPERVLAICRLLEGHSCSMQELARLTQLDKDPDPSEEAFRRSVDAAEELKLIKKDGDQYVFVGEKEMLSTTTAFRRAVAPIIFSNEKTTFFKLTEWYIKNDAKMHTLNDARDIAATASKDGVVMGDRHDVLGWRFWLRFLGHGYLYNRTVIPNMKVRLDDAMLGLKENTRMTAAQFVTWLKQNIPEAATACTGNALPLAVSNGLRTLHEEGEIELISTMDAVKISLYPIKGVELQDFSEIVIKGREMEA